MLGFDDFFQSRDFLSVEFGSSSLKVAHARPDGSSMRVDLADREAVQDLSESNLVETYTEAFRSILERQSISGGRNVGLTLPANGVIVRHLDFPSMSDERLSQVIQYEAESHIPFPVEDVVMDYHVVVRNDEETQIILVVVQREKLDQYLEVILNGDFETEMVEISSFSLFNLYQNFKDESADPSGPSALVDLGARSTDIIIFENGRLHYARSASVAGEAITEEVSQQLDVDLEQAERLKIDHGHLPLTEDEPTSPREKPPAPPGGETGGSEGEGIHVDEDDAEGPPPSPPSVEDFSSEDESGDDELTLGTEFSGEDTSPSGAGSEAPPRDTESDPSESDSAEAKPPPPPEVGEETSDSSQTDAESGPPESPAPPEAGTEDENKEDTPGSSEDLQLSLGNEGSEDSQLPGFSEGEPPPPETGEEPSLDAEPPEPELDERDTVDESSVESGEKTDEEEQDEELDLGLGELRTPGDEESGQLEDPLSEDEGSNDDSGEEDPDSPSLGASANKAPPPPEDPDHDSEALRKAIQSKVDRIIGELNQTFDYFRNEMDGEPVEEIVLCGNGSRIRNLPAYVESELNRSTRRFEPGTRLTGLPEEETQSMLVALGLQLRTDPERTTLAINLLPEEIVRRRKQQSRRRKMVANGVLAGLLLVQVVVWIFYSYQIRQGYFQKSKEQLREVQPVVQRVNELKETRSSLEKRIEAVRALRDQQARILPVLYDLNQMDESLRKQTWFQTVSYNSGSPYGTLRLQGVTDDFQDVSRIYQWLDDFEFTLTQVSENQNRRNYTIDGEQRSMVQFSVNYEVTFVPYNRSGEGSI